MSEVAQVTASQQPLVGLDGGETPRWLEPALVRQVRAAEQRPFDDAEYASRLSAVRARMERAGLDAVLVFRPSSIEYLCGYHTAETAPQPLVITDTDTYLYVPDLEVGRALTSSQVSAVHYCGYADALSGLRRFLEHATGLVPRGARIGVEYDDGFTPPRAIQYLESSHVVVADAGYLVERVRLVLSTAEIRCLEHAARITQDGVEAAVAEASRVQATDSSVAAEISRALLRRADSASAWGPLVVTGARAGIPHSSWVGKRLETGPTFVEFAGTHHRYHAPVMRTLVRGELDAADRRLVGLARTALAAVLDTARPGVPCSQVARQAGEALGRLPDDVMFHQLFGYPVGLAHKPHWMDGVPFHLAPNNHEPLREGMAFHVPASFRSFGRRCVGLSQTFVVERGGARVLTHGRAEPIELGERTP